MNKLLFITIITLTTNLSVFGQIPEWNTLNKKDYSIQYPKDWELNESGQMGADFMLFSPLSSKKDQFKENVNLLIQDLAGHNIDLDKYVEISEGQIQTIITDSNIIDSKRITKGSLDYHKIIYTGKQGVYYLKYEQYYWIVDEQAFVLTLTCEESQFDDFKTTGERILNSFSLNKK